MLAAEAHPSAEALSMRLKGPWADRHKMISLPQMALSRFFIPEEERFCLLHLSAFSHWACIQFSGKAYGVRKEKKESKDEWRFCLLYVVVDSLQKWLNWRYGCLQAPLRESCPPAGKWRVLFALFCFFSVKELCQGSDTLIPCDIHIQNCSVYKSKDVFSSCLQSLKIKLSSFCFSQLPEQ